MLYYTTWLISKIDPLKYIFEKPYMSNRLANGKCYWLNMILSTKQENP
jgi:hypothetical protein